MLTEIAEDIQQARVQRTGFLTLHNPEKRDFDFNI